MKISVPFFVFLFCWNFTFSQTPDSTKSNPKNVESGKTLTYKNELPRAVIHAVVKVSPAGVGTFLGLAKGSTSADPAYVEAVKNYLKKIKFIASEKEYIIKIQFKFNVD